MIINAGTVTTDEEVSVRTVGTARIISEGTGGRVMITGRTPGDLQAIDAIAVAFGSK